MLDSQKRRLEEAVQSQANRCEIALRLLLQGEIDLTYTVLEDIFFYQQEIVDEWCVKRSNP